MKKVLFILNALIIILLTACEKVIDVDLQNSEPLLVIEANLIAGENDFIINISKSTDFFLGTPQERIENAIVTLYEENVEVANIPSVGNGKYLKKINAKEETEYRLVVKIDEISYEATSFLPKKVDISEASYEFQEASGPLEEGYIISLSFTDPADTEGYYRLAMYEEGEFLNSPDDLQIFDDRLFNGGMTTLSLARIPFDAGKIIDLELRTMNAKGYDYFNSLSGTIGSDRGPRSGQSAPGNPNTNWNPNILGHFTAYSADIVKVQLPD